MGTPGRERGGTGTREAYLQGERVGVAHDAVEDAHGEASRHGARGDDRRAAPASVSGTGMGRYDFMSDDDDAVRRGAKTRRFLVKSRATPPRARALSAVMRMRAATLLRGVPLAASASCRRASPRRGALQAAGPVASLRRASARPAAADDARSVMFVSFLWPEASSSAAGVRTTSLLRAFQAWGWRVHYLACARPNEHTDILEASGVRTHHVAPNRGAEFEAALEAAAPDAVIFDRFMAEEAFSFRVRAARPSAARILDMQDLHSLRYARHDAVKTALATAKARPDPVAEDKTPSPVLAALAAVPEAGDDHLSRELASVHRCDLALVCSPVETTLLRDRYRVPSEKLIPASFFCDPPPREFPTPGFEPRAGFVTIGTFYHPPNVDSVRWMSKEVWPLIRLALPKATMRVYGAYPTEAIKQLHRPKQGFFVEGFAPTVQGAMEDARVLLAPLRFGAGIKGKIVDAWQNGLPVVTTPVGAEGMVPGAETLWRPNDIDDGEVWGGRWRSTDAAGIAADAVALHEDGDAWERARARGGELVGELFPAEANLAEVRAAVEGLFEEVVAEQEEVVAEQEVGAGGREGRVAALDWRRRRDYVGASLWHHTARSTEYFSRWIEVKETGEDSSAHPPEGVDE